MSATTDHSSNHAARLACQALLDELGILLQYELLVDASMMHGLGAATFQVEAVPEEIHHALADGSGRLMGRVDDACSLVTRLRGRLASMSLPS